MSVSVTPATLALLRLHSQGILPTSTKPIPGLVDVVRSLTALQGQDFPGALWSIGLRVPGSTRADVEAAFNRGEMVRSWPLRGTLHVTVAEDLGWILSLTRERMLSSMTARHRQLEITGPDLDQVRSIALGLLEQFGTGSRAGQAEAHSACGRATRDELFAAFEAAGQRTRAQRGIHLLWLLCTEGTLVQGPIRTNAGTGKTQFFVSTKTWIKNPRVLVREEALAELTLRYFRGHGPATIKDFAWWAKLTLKDINTALEQVKSQLATLECNGSLYWLAPETAELLGGQAPVQRFSGARTLLLLPGFDEYLLGYTDRSASLAAHHASLIVPGGNGMFKATVVAGGQVVGTWRKAQGAQEKESELAGVVHPELFGELSPSQGKALANQAAAHARWLSLPGLTWCGQGQPPVG